MDSFSLDKIKLLLLLVSAEDPSPLLYRAVRCTAKKLDNYSKIIVIRNKECTIAIIYEVLL